jgi:hypothetical protein
MKLSNPLHQRKPEATARGHHPGRPIESPTEIGACFRTNTTAIVRHIENDGFSATLNVHRDMDSRTPVSDRVVHQISQQDFEEVAMALQLHRPGRFQCQFRS